MNVWECAEQGAGAGILFAMIAVIIRDVTNTIYVAGKKDCRDIVCFRFFMASIAIVTGDIPAVFRTVISSYL